MNWKPDKSHSEPLHQQIFNHIRNMIRHGHYKSGDRLSIRRCATSYGVGINTVKEAFENLKAAGMLTSSFRSGTTIAENAWRIITETSYDWPKIADIGKHIHSSDEFIKACQYIDSFGGMGLNVADFNPAAPLLRAMVYPETPLLIQKHINDYNRYGFLPLREEVVKYVRRYGIETEPNNIVIFNGANEAYHVICHALLRPGMNVHTLRYDSNTIVKTAQSAGASLTEMGAGDYHMLTRKILRRGNDMLHITCVNHFPTGVTLTEENRDGFLAAICELQLPVVECDFFRDVCAFATPPPLKAGDPNDLIIYVGTFSQLAHAGSFKLAWGIIPPVIRERICDVSLQIYNTISTVNEMLGYIMLREGYYEDYIAELRPKIIERVDAVDASLRRHFGDRARWDKRDLSHFIWAELPGVDALKLLSKCNGPLFAPGTLYGAPHHINMNTLFKDVDGMDADIKHIAEKAGML